MRVLVSLAVMLVVLLPGGCARYQPSPLDPEKELRDRSIDQFVVERAAPGQQSASSSAAFDPSDGLDRAELVAVALTLNPDLRAKRLAAGEADSLLISAGKWPNPELGFGWRPGISGSGGSVIEGDLLFELLRPRERSIRKQSAQAQIDQVKAGIIAEEYKTVAEVLSSRWAVLAAEQSVKLLEEETALRRRALDLVRQRRQVGEGTELDISLSELELAEIQRDLREARGELEDRRKELNRVLGLPPDYALHLTESGRPLTVTVFEEVSDSELDRRVIQGRFELRSSEAAYAQAEKQLELAVLRQNPSLRIGPAFERELSGDKSLGIGLSLELPLFDRNQGEIAEKLAARDRLRAEYQALLHRLRSDAYAARAALRRARFEVESQEKEILPLIDRNQRLFEGAFRARELSIMDWITAQQRAVRARREYLNALVRYGASLIALETAMGMPLSQRTSTPATPTTLPVNR